MTTARIAKLFISEPNKFGFHGKMLNMLVPDHRIVELTVNC